MHPSQYNQFSEHYYKITLTEAKGRGDNGGDIKIFYIFISLTQVTQYPQIDAERRGFLIQNLYSSAIIHGPLYVYA